MSRCTWILFPILRGGVLLGLGFVGSMRAAEFEPAVDRHTTQIELQTPSGSPNIGEVPTEGEAAIAAPPARSSFMATWDSTSGASGYLLDVSASESFRDYLDGYHSLDVGNATGRVVTGLSQGTTYYYRVRPYYVTGVGNYSQVTSATTVAMRGLTILPTFDFSILINGNAAAIQAMIHRAIAIYESLFSDPITIRIYFRYSASTPDGQSLPASALSQSYSLVYGVAWSTFTNALKADAKTPNDALSKASLPHTAISSNIGIHSSNGRAIRLNTPPALFANGNIGNGGEYDGIDCGGIRFGGSRRLRPQRQARLLALQSEHSLGSDLVPEQFQVAWRRYNQRQFWP